MSDKEGNILMQEKYSLQDRIFMEQMAAEAAARHRTPEAEFDHPKGVIVPNDQLLTDNIRNDRNYVPYCGPCSPMQRMRRDATGFYCPTCFHKTNWDLTPYNGNLNVQFDPEHVDPEWLAKHQADVASRLEKAKSQEAAVKQVFVEDAQKRLDWPEDQGKKNTVIRPCNKCTRPFFGKKGRKYCRPCQNDVSQHLAQTQTINSPYARKRGDTQRRWS